MNPIGTIRSCTRTGELTGQVHTSLPVPSKYEFQLIDVSAAGAGRTEDGFMNKMKMGNSIRIDLTWAYPTREEAKRIIDAFSSEYITMEYIDIRQVSGYANRRFYIGDRKAPLWNSTKGRWESLSFGVIQQNLN